MIRSLLSLILICSVFLAPVTMTSCEMLPQDPGARGAVIGGVGGAAVGAIIARENRLLGALIGGAIGAGGGYLIGANTDLLRDRDQDSAAEAARKAETNPAQPADVHRTDSADLNNDGFVTMDEIVAMERAGLADGEIIRRLERTGYVFELTRHQQDYLREHGVSERVITAMPEINREERERLLAERTDVVGEPRR
jgi:hypothetical protein